MKKSLIAAVLFFVCMFSFIGSAYANAGWDNPKSIRTYIEPNDKKELMKQAFARWSQATDDKIVFRYVSSPDDAQITVEFVKDASKTSKMERAAGVTYPRTIGNRLVSAKIQIADNAPNGAAFRKDAVYRIMVHEIGHAIGIFQHSSDPMSIMYYAKGSRYQDIKPEDLKVLAKIYSW